MPKLTLLLGRKRIQVYDIDKPVITVGREEGVDIVIDNPSVSRKHAHFRQEGEEWVVEDLGSSNGTYMDGEKIEGPTPVSRGDQVGFGKFSVVFGKVVGEEADTKSQATAAMAGAEGTMHIKSSEVKDLLDDAERKRKAHLVWESGGQRGTHYLADAPAALFGTDHLCDVQVPKAPKHHVLAVNKDEGCEIRNLHWWSKMKVGGSTKKVAYLKDGDVVEVGGLKLTFVSEI